MKVKVTLALLFVLCLALSAFGQGSIKKDDKSSMKMTTDQMLMNNERMAWKALEEKRWDDFARMFTDDYQGVYADAIHDKATEVSGVKQAGLSNISLSDIKVSWIDKDAAIVTSVVKGSGMMPDGKMGDFSSRTTTVWKKSGKDWMVVYHSDISMKPM